MGLVTREALGSVYGNSQIAVALLPLFERAPIAIRCPHFPFEYASKELRYRDVFFSGLLSGPVRQL